MFQVKLKVPRVIYINSKIVYNDPAFKKCNKVLPRNRKVYNLYEWENNEETFQEKIHKITYEHLMSPTIEGVYQMKTPLLFKALLEMGCMVSPKHLTINKNEQALGRTYRISELEVK